jgi:hypothetical protein
MVAGDAASAGRNLEVIFHLLRVQVTAKSGRIAMPPGPAFGVKRSASAVPRNTAASINSNGFHKKHRPPDQAAGYLFRKRDLAARFGEVRFSRRN